MGPADRFVRCSHVLIKHAESRNPVSRRTGESTTSLSRADAEAEMAKWVESLEKDERPLPEKFASLAYHRSDCGSFQQGGDLGSFPW
jgi:NIMA-interacting peptidyl-prolyl cis-trans isomerase 1